MSEEVPKMERTSVMRGPAAKGGAVMDIQNFDTEIMKAKSGDYIESHIFYVQKEPFMLVVYPNGCNEKMKGRVGVGVAYVKTEGEVAVESVKLTVSGLDVSEYTQRMPTGEKGFTMKSAPRMNAKIMSLISHTTCLANLKNGVFEVKAEVEMMGERVKVGPDNRNDTHAKALCASDFKSLLADPEHADFVLKCGGKTFKCHKNILSSRSPVFRGMLALGMEEARRGEAEIRDMEPETLGCLLAFIYCGEVEEGLAGQEAVEELLYAADKYDLGSLVCNSDDVKWVSSRDPTKVKLCAENLQGVVTPKTAARILDIADRHSLVALKQVAASGSGPYTWCSLARS
jgi:hypothetical protein